MNLLVLITLTEVSISTLQISLLRADVIIYVSHSSHVSQAASSKMIARSFLSVLFPQAGMGGLSMVTISKVIYLLLLQQKELYLCLKCLSTCVSKPSPSYIFIEKNRHDVEFFRIFFKESLSMIIVSSARKCQNL